MLEAWLEEMRGERSAGEIGGVWSSSINWSWSDMRPEDEEEDEAVDEEEELDEAELEVELEESEARRGNLGLPRRPPERD